MNVPREERPLVQEHLNSLNEILDPPDLKLIEVDYSLEGSRPIFRLIDDAAARVTAKFGWLVSHQQPKIGLGKKEAKGKPAPEPVETVPGPRAIPVRARRAGIFFGIPFPEEPTVHGDVEA